MSFSVPGPIRAIVGTDSNGANYAVMSTDGYVRISSMPSTINANYEYRAHYGASSTHAGTGVDGSTGGQCILNTTNSTNYNMFGSAASTFDDVTNSGSGLKYFKMVITPGVATTWGAIGIARMLSGSTTTFRQQQLTTAVTAGVTYKYDVVLGPGESFFPMFTAATSTGTYNAMVYEVAP